MCLIQPSKDEETPTSYVQGIGGLRGVNEADQDE